VRVRSIRSDATGVHVGKVRRIRWLAGAALLACLSLVVLGGGPSGLATSVSASASASTSACGTLTVWVDATRDPALKDYETAHPCVHLQIQVLGYTAGEFQTKIGLFNKEGSGWPDVAWDPSTTDAGWLDSTRYKYAQPLNEGLIPTSYFKQWAENSLSVCTYGGKIYCLRNDIAANVVWYNAPLMKKFGYKVPTTWAEYEALGKEVAARHPGYVIGTLGDAYGEDVYYWGSGCPSNELQGTNTVLVDTTAPNCERAANMLDTLVADKSVSTLAVSSADYAKQYGDNDHTLMSIGPTWYGLFEFKPSFKSPNGTWAVSAPLTWPGFTQTGDVGGGIWQISSHASAAEQKLGVNLIEWVDTNSAYQATAPTYPANIGAAAVWLKTVNSSGFFASNPATVFKNAAGDIWPDSSALLFSTDDVWSDTVVPGLVKGESPSSLLGAWGTALKNQATVFGYQVKS
jgi:ABC-type glycerol-3-phosphate transport system substrate-binding protein